MALHDNTLPSLIQQHQQAQSVGNEYAAAELAARITEENEKRSEWAVSIKIFHKFVEEKLNRSFFSLKIVSGDITTSA